MENTRIFNWLFPNQPSQAYPGSGGIGGLLGFGSGQAPPPGPPPGTTGFSPDPGGQQMPPPGPPPGTPPVQAYGFGQQPGVGAFAVDPGAFYGCLYRYTYVLLEDGRRFWFWPTFIGRTSVAGYRWRPRQYRWVYMGIDSNRIRSFQCR